jgi:hypothetical protein
MTTAILFKKHRAGEISKEKFLYEVRRDQQLPFITNMTSYDDSIKILKNKGIVKEAIAADNIHPYLLKKGIEAELLKGGQINNLAYAKATATATKKLAKDPTAYDELQVSNSAKIEKADARLGMTPVKDGNFVDKYNGMKKIKGFNDAKANTKASKKENKRGNPKGVKMMKESAQLDILKDLLKKKVELTEDMHPIYGMGQEVDLPEEDVKEFKSQTGIIKNIIGGTLELEIHREGEEPMIINRQSNVIDKAKELAAMKSQADDKEARDNMWSDWDKKGEKTFGGIADFPSKIDADRQKKTMGIVEKLRKALGLDKKKKDVDEAMDIVKGKNPQGQEVTLDVVPTGKGTKTAQNYKQKGIKSATSTTVA